MCRDTSKFVGCGSYGFVYEGTLNPEQIRVAVKTVRCGSDAKDALKVVLYFRLFVVFPDNIEPGTAQRSVHLGQA